MVDREGRFRSELEELLLETGGCGPGLAEAAEAVRGVAGREGRKPVGLGGCAGRRLSRKPGTSALAGPHPQNDRPQGKTLTCFRPWPEKEFKIIVLRGLCKSLPSYSPSPNTPHPPMHVNWYYQCGRAACAPRSQDRHLTVRGLKADEHEAARPAPPPPREADPQSRQPVTALTRALHSQKVGAAAALGH